jgi:hypothetical protein
LPLSGIQAGQKGVGRTVFSGGKIEEFQVEVLGVLENVGPRQNIVLARLSGGPIERTGVLQGMSGSPVWIGGKLAGAVALAFPFSKEPIAGIRPIEEMIAVSSGPVPNATPTPRAEIQWGGSRLAEVATPVRFSGFTSRTIEHFAGRWREMGLSPLQGIGGQGSGGGGGGTSPKLDPGSMISVLLVSGDMQIGADGTVTHVDRDRVYAFGHRFLSLGSTELPFSRAEVITLLPSVEVSYKISASREPLGVVTTDGNTAIAGKLNARASTIPVTIEVAGASRRERYRMEMAREASLTPFLLQMILFSAIDSTERTLGSSTVSVRGEVRFEDGLPPLLLNQAYAGDVNTPIVASLSAAAPLSSLLQSGGSPVRVREIRLSVAAGESREIWQIEQLTASRRTVRPGDAVELAVSLSSGARERVERFFYTVPVGAPLGPLNVTAADGTTTNFAESRSLFSAGSKPPAQLVAQLNALRPNSSAWVRVWRPDASFQAGGVDLANVPAGMNLLLARSSPAPLLATQQGARLAEFEIRLGDAVAAGTRTVQIEVKE